jgi:hypothetical protein
MIYKIDWCEVKKEGETNGRKWKITNMTLTDSVGNTYDEVSTFDPVIAGQEIDGFIETKGMYKNFKKSLEKPKFMQKPDISKQVEKAQARTEASIGKTMDRKEESIKLAGAQRDAVLIVTNLFPNGQETEQEIKEKIIKWRNFFLNDETFNNPPPFN